MPFSLQLCAVSALLVPGLRDCLAGMIVSRRLSVVVPVAYMALLLVGASVPVDETQEERHMLWFLAIMPPVFQNLLHIPAYGLLAFFWRWSLDRYMAARAAAWLAFILTVCFGVYQEWYQSLIPGRYASLMDVAFNTIGAGVGLCAFNRLTRSTGRFIAPGGRGCGCDES